MRTQKISFPDVQSFCVFPDEPAKLAQAISTLGLKNSYPVIVLIGGKIQEQQVIMTHRVLESLAKIAEDMDALVICGCTDLAIMAEIGQIRRRKGYKFPLLGITLESFVTWPEGPRSTNFLWWGTKRWTLDPHYSHFILVPGSKIGDEAPWIVNTANILSKGRLSVTILINGGNDFRKDIKLSIENGRPVIALGGTGRLANELASEPNRNSLITVVPANAENRVDEAVYSALTTIEKNTPHPSQNR